MRAAVSGSSSVTTAPTFFPTPMLTASASVQNDSTACAFPLLSCGVRLSREAIACIWICGTAILTRPDPDAAPGAEDGPAFEEPWQAEAFALTVHLHATGAFTWREWAESLSEALLTLDRQTTASEYYTAWVTALEHLTAAKGLADQGAVDLRKTAWRQAYLATPHGQPVILREPSSPHPGG